MRLRSERLTSHVKRMNDNARLEFLRKIESVVKFENEVNRESRHLSVKFILIRQRFIDFRSYCQCNYVSQIEHFSLEEILENILDVLQRSISYMDETL